METPPFECRALDVEIGGMTLVRELNLKLTGGACVAVLGRNGAGKTTMLHTLAGLLPPGAGTVSVAGRPIEDWPRRELAQRLGLLMQNYEYPFPSTVLASALIGRHPHIGFLQWEGERDLQLAHAALSAVGLQDLAGRDVATLSGGELRRLAIATVLAQDPGIMLLDEPANHLDLNHQLMTLSLFSDKARAGHTVMISLHDVNLALRFCEHSLLLFGEGEWLFGASPEMISESNLTRLYQTPVRSISADNRQIWFAA